METISKPREIPSNNFSNISLSANVLLLRRGN
jgi:hypothetical protein